MKNLFEKINSAIKVLSQLGTISMRFNSFAFVVVLLLMSAGVKGQSTANYAFTTNTTGSLALDANGNAVDMTTGTTQLIAAGNDDLVSSLSNIGFNFIAMGNIYSQFSATSNGVMGLNSSVLSSTSGTTNGGTSAITWTAPFGGDQATNSTGKVHFKIVGSAPNRCLVVEWLNMELNYSSSTADGTYQARFYETSGVIEFVYGSMNVVSTFGTAPIIGFSGGTTSTKIASITSSSNTVSTSGTSFSGNTYSAGAIANLNSTTNGSRRVYKFTPPIAPNDASSLNFTSVSISSMVLNWTDASNEVLYMLERSSDGGTTWTTITTLPGNTITYSAIGLAPNTSYSWRLKSLSEGSSSSGITGSQTTLSCPTIASTISIGGATVSGSSYATLTAAIADLQGCGISQPTILELSNTYTSASETFPITLSNVSGASATNTITIRPATGVSGSVITSANTTATIDINGGQYWIIDGRPGGVGVVKQLTIDNTATSVTGGTIRLINDAHHNTITYCNVTGVATTITVGNITFSTTTGSLGNSDNTVSNCSISDGATTPTNGIYSLGTAGFLNNNNTIIDNNIFNFYNSTSISNGGVGVNLSTNNSNWTISNNSLYQTASRTIFGSAAVFNFVLISSSTVNGTTISGNYMGGTAPLCGSTPLTLNTIATLGFRGIQATTGTTTATSIQGNTIQNIAITTASVSTANNAISLVSGSFNVGNITANTIGSQSVANSIIFVQSTTSTATYFVGISAGTGTPGVINISNNLIGGIAVSNSSNGTINTRGISLSGLATSYTVSGNTIGSTSVANSISNSSGGFVGGIVGQSSAATNSITGNTIVNLAQTNTTTTSAQIVGILSAGSSGGAYTVTGNTIRNLSSPAPNLGTTSSASVIGISHTAATTVGQTVSQNTIYALSNTHASAATAITGIHYAGPTTGTNIVARNLVYNLNLSTTSTSADMRGINFASGLATIQNNMIRLGYNATGAAAIANGIPITGLYEANSTANSAIYFNSVYIGGTGVGVQTGNTHAFRTDQTTNARIFQNNIFVNARSNAAAGGKHYAIRQAGTNTPPVAGLTLNYNDYFVSGTGGVFGYFNTADVVSLAAWKTAVGQDANSINSNPCLNDPTAATPDLHLTTCSGAGSPVDGTGVLITSVTDDIDGETRSSFSPTDMGADAGNYGNSGLDMKATALVSPTTSGCKTATETVSVSVTNMSSATIDFSVNNVTVTVTGTGGYSSSKVVNTGTLGAGLSQTVTMPTTIDLTASGTYTFNANTTVTGDLNTGNDAMAASSPIIILGGTYTVGVSGANYTTLTAAVAAANSAACISAPIILSLIDATNYTSGETYPITINANSQFTSTNTLTIKPATGVTANISGSAASSALIKIASKYVIIDGSNTAGGTTRNLTITNTSTTTPSVIIIGNSGTSTATALTDVTIKNTILINGVNTSSAVIVANNLAAAGYFNNITIQNNSVQKAYIGIYAVATAATGNGSGLLITGNDLNATSPNSLTYTGIFVQGVDGATVSNNNIANITSSTVSPYGVVFNTGTNSGSISGNTISSLSFTGTGGTNAPVGIYLGSGTTATAISVSNNTISGLTSSGTTGVTSGIYTNSVNHTIFNNKISNIKNTNAGGYLANGIFLASTSTTAGITLYNNFIFNIAGVGFSAATDNGHGIVLYSGGGYNLYNNTINMNANQSTGVSSAIYIYSNLVTAASVNIRNNIFANTQTDGAPVANRYAIYCAAENTIFGTINHNNYYSSTGTNLGYLGSARTNLAGIVTGFGGDANSISVAPTFTSATDLHLTSANTALKAGTYISSVLTDYDGDTRNVLTPTMGADEIYISNLWTGTSSTAFATTGNWDDNAVPSSGANITIPTGVTNKPVLASDKTIGTLALGSGTTLSIGSNTLTINGAVSGTGTLTGSSTSNLTIAGAATTLNFTSGSRSLNNLSIGASGAATLGTALDIYGTIGFTTGGSLNMNAQAVALKSTASATASISDLTGSTLSGATNLTVERYIPALRKFRFLAAPVVGATAANWRNNGVNTAGIGTHITGSLGAANNFDPSTTNAASAFGYNEALAGNDVTVGSGATSDSGWTAFTDGNTEALTNGKGFRVFVRGDRTISLDGSGSVTPTNTTLSVTGTYPANSVSIATTKTNSNTNSGFNLVGNPYPATIDWNAVTKGADISTTYTTYNPNTGAYVAWNGTTGDASQYIASSQAFFVQQTGATGGITIAEANKATNAAGNYFRNKLADHLKVSMNYDSANYDAAFIHFREDAQNDFDTYDGLKFQNAGVNIASVGAYGKRYNINSLASLNQTTEIPLSVLGSVLTNFELKFDDVQTFKNHELYLIDHYLNKMLALSDGFTYPIELSSDSASVKDGRFKIVFVQKATGINTNKKNANAFILYPNPAANSIHLLLDAKNTNNENVSFEIYNQLGAMLQQGSLDFTSLKDQTIAIDQLAQGSYFIKLKSKSIQQTIKFIK